MRALTVVEVDEVSGAFLANIGAGMGGATIAMGAYSLYGAMNGSLSFGVCRRCDSWIHRWCSFRQSGGSVRWRRSWRSCRWMD